ncbi:MAG: sugar ABC transporter substrate-binding protein [Christensenellales bacterium]
MKKVGILVLALLMVLSLLTACGGGGETADPTTPPSQGEVSPSDNVDTPPSNGEETDYSTMKIGVVMKSFDEFQQAVMDGAKDMAAEYGIPEENVMTLAPATETDVMQQVEMIEDCISQGVKILLVSPNQPDTVMNALSSAVSKGIMVVTVDTDAPDFADKVTYIGTDNEAAAYEGALAFSDMIPEGSNVIILRGKLGDPNHEARTKGLTDALEEKGHTVLTAEDANCETDKATNVTENLLTKYGSDGIDAVMVTSDSMALGAVTALKQANIADKVAVCGFDGFQAAIEGVRDGDILMIIAQKPYFIGQKGIECGIGALEGKTYDAYINSGIAIIGQENFEDFLNS